MEKNLRKTKVHKFHLPFNIFTATATLPFLPPIPIASAFITTPNAPEPNCLPIINL